MLIHCFIFLSSRIYTYFVTIVTLKLDAFSHNMKDSMVSAEE